MATDRLAAEGQRLLSRATRIRVGWKLRASKMDGGDRYDLIGDPCGFPVATFGDLCDVEFYEWVRCHGNRIFAALARLDRMTEALEKARDRFREYEKAHLDKVMVPDRGCPAPYIDGPNKLARAKAARNREMADLCARALGGQIGEG